MIQVAKHILWQLNGSNLLGCGTVLLLPFWAFVANFELETSQ